MKKTFNIILIIVSINLFPQDSLFYKIKRMIDSVSSTNLVTHIKTLEYASGYESRVNFTPGNDSAVRYIKKVFQSNPNLKVELDTFYISSATPPLNTKPLFNVVATIPGKSSKYVIIGAHLDCSASRMGSIWNTQWNTIKAPGADDNATGLSAIMEIARIISDTSFNFFNDYTIKIVAFGAEEYGPAYSGHHFGSESFANKAKLKNDTIVATISLDMIGYNQNQFYQSIVSDNASKWIGNKIIEIKEKYSLNVITNKPPFIYANYSDHYSFWLAGYNAILLIENAPPWNDNLPYYVANQYYHTSSDTFETLNMNLIKKMTQLCLATICNLSKQVTNTDENNSQNKFNYYLNQNYPNPFNPKTKIKYQISKLEFVTLKVYDILGNEIAKLVEEIKSPGNYEVEFNTLESRHFNKLGQVVSTLSCGVYFYQLKAGNFIQTKKMIYLK